MTGKVIGQSDKEPLIGATIAVKGSRKAVVTDTDGKFSIQVPSASSVLNITYVGMKPVTVKVKTGAPMTIEMESSESTLNEVVVTGMTVTDKRLFTGATTKVDAQESRISGMADISRSLEGRAAGVTVQNVSATFGTAPKIRVRGATSIFGSSKPLWVVDGVIMEDVLEVSADELSSGNAETLISSAIAGLNADDIESFDILKDGSATSIYGARAMAGVIVITTKKGKSGQNSVNYTGEFTTRLKPSYSTFNIMNSQDQMGIYQELEQKGYLKYAETANAATSGVYGKMYQLITEYDRDTQKFLLENTPEARAAYLRAAEYRNTDWFDQLFQTSMMQNHSISLSSGTSKAQHYVSASAMYDPGWYKQSNVNRYTLNLNSSFNITDKLTVNVIGNASTRSQRAPGTLGRDIDAATGEVKRDFDINPYSYALNTSRTLDANTFYTRAYAPFNIMHELNNNYIDLGVNDFRLSGNLTFKPSRHLELQLLAGMQTTATSQEHHILDKSNQAEAYRAMATTAIMNNNRLLYEDPAYPNDLPITILPYGGIYERTDRLMNKWDMRASARYNNTFAEKHIVNGFAGMETNSVDRHSSWFRGWGLQYSMGETPSYAYQVFKRGQEEGTDYFNLSNRFIRSVAFFGNATYSYDGKYTFNGTLRYEGTNSLGKSRQSRWLPTWNISGSWNMHQEKWWEDIAETWSHMRLRASYSLTGDRPSISNAYAIFYARNSWRPSADLLESELYVSSLANSDLTYEKKHELNLGISTGFFNNRINVEADWYTRNNYDLIGMIATQGFGGQIDKYGNIASMKSNGVELSLTTKNIETKNFSWTTNLIYSHNSNKVTDLRTTKRMIDYITASGFTQEGYPVRSLFSIDFKGLNEDGLPTFINEKGDLTVSSINFQERDTERLSKNLVYSGNMDPTDLGSIGNIFRYKNFSLNAYVTYSFGNVLRLNSVFRSRYDDLVAMPREFNNRWVVPGDEKHTDIPVIASLRQNKNDSKLYQAYNAYNLSTARVAKGDFVRMKEISLSYQVPSSFAKMLRMSRASVKIQATNLFLIYADKKLNGNDPEFFNTGGVAAPTPKQFTMTLNLGF